EEDRITAALAQRMVARACLPTEVAARVDDGTPSCEDVDRSARRIRLRAVVDDDDLEPVCRVVARENRGDTRRQEIRALARRHDHADEGVAHVDPDDSLGYNSRHHDPGDGRTPPLAARAADADRLTGSDPRLVRRAGARRGRRPARPARPVRSATPLLARDPGGVRPARSRSGRRVDAPPRTSVAARVARARALPREADAEPARVHLPRRVLDDADDAGP